MALVMKVRYGEKVTIGDAVLQVFRVSGSEDVSLCIDAPREIEITRERAKKKKQEEPCSTGS